jgi:putative membrane protein
MLLTQEQTRIIEAKLRAAEQHTAGELVVAILPRSDDYAAARAFLAASFALVLASLGQAFLPWTAPVWFLASQVPVALASYWLLGTGPFLRRVVPRSRQHECVEARAFQLFAERGVANTRDRSGVLICVSAAERRVRILADRGINDRVAATEWEEDVALIVEGMRSKNPARGIGQAVDRIGAVLAASFPRRDDDENELPDTLLRLPH